MMDQDICVVSRLIEDHIIDIMMDQDICVVSRLR